MSEEPIIEAERPLPELSDATQQLFEAELQNITKTAERDHRSAAFVRGVGAFTLAAAISAFGIGINQRAAPQHPQRSAEHTQPAPEWAATASKPSPGGEATAASKPKSKKPGEKPEGHNHRPVKPSHKPAHKPTHKPAHKPGSKPGSTTTTTVPFQFQINGIGGPAEQNVLLPPVVTSAPSPNTTIPSPPPVETTPTGPTELNPSASELESFNSQEINSELAKTTVTITIGGTTCSGEAFFTNGELIGGVSAGHCGWEAVQNNLQTTKDGTQTYYRFGQVTVFDGPEAGDLNAAPGESTEIGVVDKVYVDNSGDNDQILWGVPGHDMQEVIDANDAVQMTPDQIAALPQGTVLIEAGKPVLGNSTTPDQVTYSLISMLGLATNWTVTVNGSAVETLPSVVVGVMPSETTSPGCLPGESGGPVYAYNTTTKQLMRNADGQPLRVGTANSYNPLTSSSSTPTASFNWLQSTYNVDLSGYAGGYNCVVAYQGPNATGQAQLIPVGNPEDPGTGINNTAEQLRDYFNQEGFQPSVIEGTVTINVNGTDITVENPIYYYDAGSDTIVFANFMPGSSTNPSDHLVVYAAISNASKVLPTLTVSGNTSQSEPNLDSVGGPFFISADEQGFEGTDEDNDDNDLEFGKIVTSSPTGTPTATMGVVGGRVVLVPTLNQ